MLDGFHSFFRFLEDFIRLQCHGPFGTICFAVKTASVADPPALGGSTPTGGGLCATVFATFLLRSTCLVFRAGPALGP